MGWTLARAYTASQWERNTAWPTCGWFLAGTDTRSGLLTWGENCKTVPIRLEHVVPAIRQDMLEPVHGTRNGQVRTPQAIRMDWVGEALAAEP